MQMSCDNNLSFAVTDLPEENRERLNGHLITECMLGAQQARSKTPPVMCCAALICLQMADKPFFLFSVEHAWSSWASSRQYAMASEVDAAGEPTCEGAPWMGVTL